MRLCFERHATESARYAMFSDEDSNFGRCYEASAVRVLIQ